MSGLTHLDENGRARMVDVTDKQATSRTATARGLVTCKPETLAQVRAGAAPKGSVVHTAELIPLCHPLPLTKVAVRIEQDDELPGFRVASEVRTKAETGVEMEALTAVSIACLTLFDMLKAIDRSMVIGGIEVVTKTGGKSGDWRRE